MATRDKIDVMEEVPVLPFGMSVPMAVPDGFETHEQHRIYLSWRINVQIFVEQIIRFEKSTDQEKQQWLKRIQEKAKTLREMAMKFPIQTFPKDLLVMNYNRSGLDSPALNAETQDGMVFLNVETLTVKILSLITNAIDASIAKVIENTLSFSQAMENIFVEECRCGWE